MEGGIGERLKREYGIKIDGPVAMASLVYDSRAREALAELWGGYADIAYRHNMPFIATTPTRRANKERILSAGYGPAIIKDNVEFQSFVLENKDWLDNYALYMAVKTHFNNTCWVEWDEDIKLRKPEALKKYQKEYADEVEFYQFQQYLFAKQWKALKAYANQNGIKIIGDIPIYVAFDSSDAWANPELFQFDENCNPIAVAGCPPDGFSATGQLWGNPLYRWEYHKETGYAWWLNRLEATFEKYDVLRIDHFRGFDEYYAIPYGEPTAENGQWEPGPGYDLFKTMKAALGKKEIIAEDLGFLTPSVLKLVKKTGYPGMKVLQFAFDSREESDYLPHNYTKNCVVYTGTHDNDTTEGWFTWKKNCCTNTSTAGPRKRRSRPSWIGCGPIPNTSRS